MKRRVLLFGWGVSAILLLGSSCSYLRKSYRTEDVLFEHSWVLCNIGGKKIDIGHFKQGVPTIKLDQAGNVLIFTGCDYIFGEYIFVDNDDSIYFKFDQEGFCLGPLGNDFVNGLKDALRLEISKEKLLLKDSTNVLMTFYSK